MSSIVHLRFQWVVEAVNVAALRRPVKRRVQQRVIGVHARMRV
jgi:hypothetical protein